MKILLTFIFVFFFFAMAIAQEGSLLKGLEDSTATEKVEGTFKSTRVINSQSVQMLGKKSMDFRILHRFGRVNQGIDQFFGLDQAAMRLGFDYGITNDVMIGVGRSTFRKEIDGFVKTRLLQQAVGAQPIPVTVVVIGGAMTWTEKSFDPVKPSFSDRSSLYGQLLVARKFNSKVSLQLSFILLHMNFVSSADLQNTVPAFGIGGRYKFSKRMAAVLDFHHVTKGLPSNVTDPLSVGIDIETGGHVFQLHFSNAVGMNERAFLAQTTDKFFKGDIRFGFNLSRIFQIGHRKLKS